MELVSRDIRRQTIRAGKTGSDLPTDILSHAMFCLTGNVGRGGELSQKNEEKKRDNTPFVLCFCFKTSLRKTFQMKTGLLCFKMKESAGETHFHVSRFTRRLVLT